MCCDHEEDLRFVYLCVRAGYLSYGDPVLFTCRDCNQKVTEVLRPHSPDRNWIPPKYEQSPNPEIEARFAEDPIVKIA